jgi:integrase
MTFRRDEISLRNLLPVFKQEYLFSITPQMVEKYKVLRLQQNVEPATVNREIACLRHMFNKANEWDYLKNNPIQSVRMLKEPPGRIRYLEPDEIEKLLKVIDNLPRNTGVYLKPIVILALNTGLRKSEILQLRWRNINLVERKIEVLRTKTNELLSLPMNETCGQSLKIINRHPQSEYVFCDKKGIPYGNVRKSFESALKMADISDFRFHDLRHTFASHLVMSGCDFRTVQQLMGHKDIKMTMRYAHLSQDHLQEAVGKLDSLWTLFGHQKNSTKRFSVVTN